MADGGDQARASVSVSELLQFPDEVTLKSLGVAALGEVAVDQGLPLGGESALKAPAALRSARHRVQNDRPVCTLEESPLESDSTKVRWPWLALAAIRNGRIALEHVRTTDTQGRDAPEGTSMRRVAVGRSNSGAGALEALGDLSGLVEVVDQPPAVRPRGRRSLQDVDDLVLGAAFLHSTRRNGSAVAILTVGSVCKTSEP